MATEVCKAKVRLVGRFPAGTKLELRERTGRRFADSEKVVGRRKSDKDSVVCFESGVKEGASYWIVGRVGDEVRAVQVTGKVAVVKERKERPGTEAARPHQRDDPRWFGEFTEPEKQKLEDVPLSLGLPQSAVPAGVQQRSATRFGEATPVDPREFSPQVPQHAVPAGTPQRSDTEHGAAATIPHGEQSPGLAQEEVNGVAQQSDTPHGEATPIITDPLRAALMRDASESQAYGQVVEGDSDPTVKDPEDELAPDGSAEVPASPVKKKAAATKPAAKTSRARSRKPSGARSTEAKRRSDAAKKAAATRKRNAAKSNNS